MHARVSLSFIFVLLIANEIQHTGAASCTDFFRSLPIHYGTVRMNLPGLTVTFSSLRGSLTLYKEELCFSAWDRRYSEHDVCFSVKEFRDDHLVVYAGGRHFSFGGITVEDRKTRRKTVFSSWYGKTVVGDIKTLLECI